MTRYLRGCLTEPNFNYKYRTDGCGTWGLRTDKNENAVTYYFVTTLVSVHKNVYTAILELRDS